MQVQTTASQGNKRAAGICSELPSPKRQGNRRHAGLPVLSAPQGCDPDSLFESEVEQEALNAVPDTAAEEQDSKVPNSLSEEEVCIRRLANIQDLYKLYKMEYWGLAEELRSCHKRHQARTRQCGWKDPLLHAQPDAVDSHKPDQFASIRDLHRSGAALAGPPVSGGEGVTCSKVSTATVVSVSKAPWSAPKALAEGTAALFRTSPAPQAATVGAPTDVKAEGAASEPPAPSCEHPAGASTTVKQHHLASPAVGVAHIQVETAAVGDVPEQSIADSVRGYGSNEEPPTFSDVEQSILDADPQGLAADPVQLKRWYRQWGGRMGRVSRLEQCAGAGAGREMDGAGAVAALAGRHHRWLIKHPAVTLGRSTASRGQVDVDLAQEGDAGRVSRKQAQLCLRRDGHFWLRNTGRRPILVNDVQVGEGQARQLEHLSLMEVGGISLLFLVNHGAVRRILHRSHNLSI